MFLSVHNITKSFGSFTALDQVSLDVEKGEFVSILGPSGCGKTTLLRVIAGLEPQNAGAVWINGNDVSREPVSKRGLGIVFQSYALFPNISIVRNVEYGLRNQPRIQKRARALEMLDLVGLNDQADKFPAQLSGGQQQRVALARALAPKPSLLLLDEPLSALDARVRIRLRSEIRRIQEKLGVTTIMVTHDQEEALTMADRILVMNEGKLMQYADPRAIYAAPSNTFVAEFIGAMNFLPGCLRKSAETVTLLGQTLQVSPAATLVENEEKPCLAIRPEHVQLGKTATGNQLRGRVRHIEFRGSVSRVTVQLLYPEGHPFDLRIEVDILPETELALGLVVEDDVHLTLPREHLLVFSGDEARSKMEDHAA